MFIFIIGLMLVVAMMAFFMAIFFQLNKIEKTLEETVQVVEVNLMNQFGELQAKFEEELEKGNDDDD